MFQSPSKVPLMHRVHAPEAKPSFGMRLAALADGSRRQRAGRSLSGDWGWWTIVVEPWQLLEILEPLFRDKRRIGEQMRDRIRKVFAWARAHGYRCDNPMDDIMAAIPKGQAQGQHYAALKNGDVAQAVAKVRGANFVIEPVKFAF